MARQLTKEDRDRIAQLFHQGASQSEIAEAIGRSPSTVCRELSRNRTGGEYLPCQAQEQADERRRLRPIQCVMDDAKINDFVRSGITSYWSPEQIAGRLNYVHAEDPDQHVSAATIYRWIRRQGDEREHWESFLRRRGKQRRRRKNQGEGDDRATIHGRPAVIEERERLGDFEGDTVLGPPGTGGVVTLVDRVSRAAIITKIIRKEARYVKDRIKERLEPIDQDKRHSMTFDNGTEFAECHRLEKSLDMDLYFADPGCPFQRGTNENTNGLVRQFFPKGTDFREVSHHEVREVERLLNNRPRACLGFRTPNEVFHEQPAPSDCV